MNGRLLPGGVLLGILGGGVPPGFPNPDPISDQKMPFFTAVFRPGLQEIISSILRLEQQRKRSLKLNPFRFRIFLFLSYSFGIDTINTFVHYRGSLEKHTRFQTKMTNVYSRFQSKTWHKTLPLWAVHLYGLY